MTRRLSIVIAAALGFGALATATAEAGGRFSGGVHFGGGAHFGGGGFSGGFHGGVHVGTSYHWSGGGGGYYRPHYWGGIGGHIWVGGGYGYGYYPYYYSYPVVPSYYGASYYPVEASVYGGPSTIPVIAPRPELPKLGIGLFAGGVNTPDANGNSQPTSSDVGILGRYRLTPGLIVEGELGKTSYDVQNVNNLRVDRRLGASLIYEIGAYNMLAPYVLGGLGVQQADVGGNYSTTQDFAEIGVGLRLAITPHFHIAADIRAGSRATVSNDQMPSGNTLARTVTPPATGSGQTEDYTRGRLSAILYF